MIRKKILLTGGRAPAVLDMARQFHAFGHEIYVAETTDMHFCKPSLAVKHCIKVPNPVTDEPGYIAALKNICTQYHIDYLIPNYMEIYPIARERLNFPAHTRVFCDDINTIDTLNNKQKFMELCERLGVSIPKTRVVTDRSQYLADIKAGTLNYPHVIKSVYCAGGTKTLTIRSQEQALDQPLEAPFLVQDFIEGRIWSTYGIAHQGRLTCHVNYYPWYTFRENGGAICFQAHDNKALLELISIIVGATQFTGQLGFDVMEKPDGSLCLIECNPRITSGVQLIRGHLDLFEKIDDPDALFESVDSSAPIQLNRAAMCVILCAQKNISFKRWMYYFIHSKDALFSWRDPGPALLFPYVIYQYLKDCYKSNKKLEDHFFLDVDYSAS